MAFAHLGRGDHEIAYGSFKIAAEAGELESMARLGELCTARGELNKAHYYWFEKAAKAGHSPAMVSLGVLIAKAGEREGLRIGSPRPANAGAVAGPAQDRLLDSRRAAMLQVGIIAADRGNLVLAGVWFRMAATVGHPLAAQRRWRAVGVENMGRVAFQALAR